MEARGGGRECASQTMRAPENPTVSLYNALLLLEDKYGPLPKLVCISHQVDSTNLILISHYSNINSYIKEPVKEDRCLRESVTSLESHSVVSSLLAVQIVHFTSVNLFPLQ